MRSWQCCCPFYNGLSLDFWCTKPTHMWLNFSGKTILKNSPFSLTESIQLIIKGHTWERWWAWHAWCKAHGWLFPGSKSHNHTQMSKCVECFSHVFYRLAWKLRCSSFPGWGVWYSKLNSWQMRNTFLPIISGGAPISKLVSFPTGEYTFLVFFPFFSSIVREMSFAYYIIFLTSTILLRYIKFTHSRVILQAENKFFHFLFF